MAYLNINKGFNLKFLHLKDLQNLTGRYHNSKTKDSIELSCCYCCLDLENEGPGAESSPDPEQSFIGVTYSSTNCHYQQEATWECYFKLHAPMVELRGPNDHKVRR